MIICITNVIDSFIYSMLMIRYFYHHVVEKFTISKNPFSLTLSEPLS
jgi:hypothetical protein